jgi:ABC-type nitrate/sulfonate/bicarbonate transport system substrate-binding protein
VAPAAYGGLSLQLSWIKNIAFAGEFFADSKGYDTAAGFTKVDLVTGPVDSADALVAAGTVDVGLSSVGVPDGAGPGAGQLRGARRGRC